MWGKKQKNEQTEKKEEACGVGKATVLTPFRVLVNIDTRNLMDKILIFRFFTSYIYIYIYIYIYKRDTTCNYPLSSLFKEKIDQTKTIRTNVNKNPNYKG